MPRLCSVEPMMVLASRGMCNGTSSSTGRRPLGLNLSSFQWKNTLVVVVLTPPTLSWSTFTCKDRHRVPSTRLRRRGLVDTTRDTCFVTHNFIIAIVGLPSANAQSTLPTEMPGPSTLMGPTTRSQPGGSISASSVLSCAVVAKTRSTANPLV